MSKPEAEAASFILSAAAMVRANDLARLAADGVIPEQREPGDESGTVAS